MSQKKCFPSGRWLWVGGTPWIEEQRNFFGAYNCTSFVLKESTDFGRYMGLSMCGSGSGAVLEQSNVALLPPISSKLNLTLVGNPGDIAATERFDDTFVTTRRNDGRYEAGIHVGDSREGWVDAFQAVIDLAMFTDAPEIDLKVHLGAVREKGARLHGFGGIANPDKLSWLFTMIVPILNGAVGRKLTPLECCKLVDSSLYVVVAGGIRRSAGMKQFSPGDIEAITSKDNLWVKSGDQWKIDPNKEMLRMSNHTAVFHRPPTKTEVETFVRRQYYSGEGAIQVVPEALYRTNVDLIGTNRLDFLRRVSGGENAIDVLRSYAPEMPVDELEHRASRYGLNPCLRGDMKILTINGYKPIGQLSGSEVEFINADGQVSRGKVWSSGVKPTVRLKLSSGDTLYCTPDHRWMTHDGQTLEAKDLVGKQLKRFTGEPRQVAPTVLSCLNDVSVEVFDFSEPLINWGVVEGFVCHNCGEISGSDFLCNLSSVEANMFDPRDLEDQKESFRAATLSAALYFSPQATQASPNHQSNIILFARPLY